MLTTRTQLTLTALVVLAPLSASQTITVTTGADAIDVSASTATVADLPGPDGKVSLSEALIASNNTSGHQTIEFAIPESDWLLQFLYPGRAVLQTSIGFYWRAYDEVTIDGTSQTAFTGDTNPDGAELVLFGSTLYLNADNCTLSVSTAPRSRSRSRSEHSRATPGSTSTCSAEATA